MLKVRIKVVKLMVRGEYLKIDDFKATLQLPRSVKSSSLVSSPEGYCVFDEVEKRVEWSIAWLKDQSMYTLEGEVVFNNATELEE